MGYSAYSCGPAGSSGIVFHPSNLLYFSHVVVTSSLTWLCWLLVCWKPYWLSWFLTCSVRSGETDPSTAGLSWDGNVLLSLKIPLSFHQWCSHCSSCETITSGISNHSTAFALPIYLFYFFSISKFLASM